MKNSWIKISQTLCAKRPMLLAPTVAPSVDEQRQRCYDAEQHMRLPLSTAETIDSMQRLAGRIWSDYRLYALAPSPLIKAARSDAFRSSSYHNGTITISKWQSNTKTLLHELAHQIAGNKHRHDAYFVSVMLGLYHRYGGLSLQRGVMVLHDLGVQWSHETLMNVAIEGGAQLIPEVCSTAFKVA
ncbi:MAG: hypothetical protein V2J24_23735 [Pseudomonadales bacterium]|jgi:hypothetical protein|nr:hypothetical protein [Pseudomonadales bacterium]